MKCIKCNKEIINGSNFCEFCGAKQELIIKDKFCVNCGTNITDKKYCSNCGCVSEMGNTVLLTVSRRKRTLGFAVSFNVFVDGINIGKLKNNSSLSYNLSIGSHKVIIDSIEKNTEVLLDIKENTNNVEIVVEAKMGIIAATARLLDVIYK